MGAIVLLLGVLTGGINDGPDAACREAIAMCDANHDSFDNYRCVFRVTQASAKSAQAALANQLVSAKHYDAIYAFRRGESGYRVLDGITVIDDKKSTKTAAGYMSPAFGVSRQFVGNGSEGMMYNGTMSTVSVEPVGTPPRGPDYDPLGYLVFGWHEPHALSALLTNDNYTFTPIGPTDLDGAPALAVAFANKKTGDRKIFWLSPAHNYAIKQVELKSTGVESSLRIVVDGFIVGKGGSSFPSRLVRIIAAGGGRLADCSVLELRVMELKFGGATDDDMRISVPAGTAILTTHGERNIFFRLPKDEKFSMRDLPGIRAKLALVEEGMVARAHGLETARIDTGFDPDRHRPWYKNWMIVAPTCLIAGFLSWHWFKRRSA